MIVVKLKQKQILLDFNVNFGLRNNRRITKPCIDFDERPRLSLCICSKSV